MSDEFRQAISDAGLMPPDLIQPGMIHRFPGEGKSNGNKAGWCMLFDDANGGIYGDWSTGLEGDWHENREFTLEEKTVFAKEREQARKKLALERKETQSIAAQAAHELWDKANPETGLHKYLRDKNINPYGIKSDGFNLLVPMYDADRKLCSIQTINPNGDKLFHKGGRIKGCYYPIGKPNGVLCLAEGFATAATIHEATGHAVAVCFNANNLQPVAETLSQKLPNTKLIICADDDTETRGNPGITKANEAASVSGGIVVVPDFGSERPDGMTDFNDMAQLANKEAVSEVITSSINQKKTITNTIDWTERFTVSEEEAALYDNPEWLYKNLIISGHVIAIPAPPNGGKTTIMMHVAAELAKKELSIFYVNADVGRSDAKSMVKYSADNNFKLLLPDMKQGLSMEDVVNNLSDMNAQGTDFSSYIFIFDTLKKMTDVINKKHSKELYKLLRSLSAKGMTIILLAHTNKYKDDEGKPIYEGTGDLRSDVDELIYFVPEKHDDGGMTVSTEPDKTRGKFEPISFEIDEERNVKQCEEYIDVVSKLQSEKRLDDDSAIIEAIEEAIRKGQYRQTEIVKHCHGVAGRRVVRRVLKWYSQKPDQRWIEERGFENNVMTYRLDIPHE